MEHAMPLNHMPPVRRIVFAAMERLSWEMNNVIFQQETLFPCLNHHTRVDYAPIILTRFHHNTFQEIYAAIQQHAR
jgi:hypothetical protein